MSSYMKWRRKWQHTPVFLPGESQGWGSLVGCRVVAPHYREGNGTPLQYSCLENPWMEEPGRLQLWGRWESDTTERRPFHFSLSCIGEGNGNPLQCSCLENPRDGGAWWAAVYGVTESDTTEATWRQQQQQHVL